MSNKDARRDNAETANEKSTEERSAGTPPCADIARFCGPMMAEMRKSCCGGLAGTPEVPSEHKRPGIFGRLALRMMKACCGPATKPAAPSERKG
jgi:hypothetical protein